MQFTIPAWADMHAHLRQGDMLAPLIAAHARTGCRLIVAMPNTDPPVCKPFRTSPHDFGISIEEYWQEIYENGAGQHAIKIIVPMYLTKDTTPKMIEDGAAKGTVQAVKYYPQNATTNAGYGVDLDAMIGGDVLKAMESCGVILNLHGEMTGEPAWKWFGRHGNAETRFYGETFRRLCDSHPGLRIVCEHITTAYAADIVDMAGPNVAATITPQHLLYNVGDLLQGWNSHLRCMPVLKFEEDRLTLLRAIMTPGQTKFFAGTDSAPHTLRNKSKDCGCASGCFTGPVAPQLYAEAFADNVSFDFEDETDLAKFVAFMCNNGPEFYGVSIDLRYGINTVTMEDKPQQVKRIWIEGESIVPLPSSFSKSYVGSTKFSIKELS